MYENISIEREKLLKENYSPDTGKLIIFLTPGYDIVNGGIMSISSIYEESIKIKHIHKAEVIMCTIPGQPSILRYTKFNNNNYIYGFSHILSYFQNLQSLIIHIPEYVTKLTLDNISGRDYQILKKIRDVHINIMLQNIDLFINRDYIAKLKELGKLTCTTAHEQYSTLELRKEIGCPLHKLSTFISPEQYNKICYSNKENWMIVSPDDHPKKYEIIGIIAKQFPEVRILIINNLTYDQYKQIIANAKWVLTFGEGLDGYFVETIFSGGIGFSVNNAKFFTNDFGSLQTVYKDYNILTKKICSDLKNLDNELNYTSYQNEQYNLCRKYYNHKTYIDNLISFYNEDYTYK